MPLAPLVLYLLVQRRELLLAELAKCQPAAMAMRAVRATKHERYPGTGTRGRPVPRGDKAEEVGSAQEVSGSGRWWMVVVVGGGRWLVVGGGRWLVVGGW